MSTIQAMLVKYKPLETSPYMKIELSVPAEIAKHVIDTLGYPVPGESIWVEITPLKDSVPE